MARRNETLPLIEAFKRLCVTLSVVKSVSDRKLNEKDSTSHLRLEWNIDTVVKAFVSRETFCFFVFCFKSCFLVFYFKSCFLVFYVKSWPTQFHALLVFTWIQPFLQTWVRYKKNTASIKKKKIFHDFTRKALIKSLPWKWIKNRDIPSANIGILTFFSIFAQNIAVKKWFNLKMATKLKYILLTFVKIICAKWYPDNAKTNETYI